MIFFVYKNLKIALIMSIFFVLTLPVFVLAANHPLEDALYLTGARLEEVNVHGWSKLGTDYLEIEELNKVLEKVIESIPYKITNAKVKASSASNFNMVIFSGELRKGGNIFVSIQSISRKVNGAISSETYLAIDISRYGNGPNLKRVEGLVKGMLKKTGPKGQIASCLTGRINGKLGKDSKKKLVGKLVSHSNIKIIQQDINEQTMNLLGYSSIFGDAIFLKGNMININLIIRYDELKMQTEVLLGSPILSVDL